MISFTYIGLALSALGMIVGGFSTIRALTMPIEVTTIDFRVGAPMFLGSLALGILGEISLSLHRLSFNTKKGPAPGPEGETRGEAG